jgi:hypothetical protein
VCHRRLGKSQQFLIDKDIRYTLDLIGPKDLHPIVMTEGEVRIFYCMLKSCVDQMIAVSGNLCVYCYSGRSRSPAIVAAYMVL